MTSGSTRETVPKKGNAGETQSFQKTWGITSHDHEFIFFDAYQIWIFFAKTQTNCDQLMLTILLTSVSLPVDLPCIHDIQPLLLNTFHNPRHLNTLVRIGMNEAPNIS